MCIRDRISGVQIEKTDTGILGITMTVVDIKDEHGAEAMGKPVGEYITLEFSDSGWRKSDEEGFEKVFAGIIEKMILKKTHGNRKIKVLTAGLGNRYATPDMLGNKVIEYIDIIPEKICAIAPGVLAQTGMETCDIIKKIVSEGGFDYILVIDSLCSRHTERLCHTCLLYTSTINNIMTGINQETVWSCIDFDKGTFSEQKKQERDYFCKYLKACKADGVEVYLLERCV